MKKRGLFGANSEEEFIPSYEVAPVAIVEVVEELPETEKSEQIVVRVMYPHPVVVEGDRWYVAEVAGTYLRGVLVKASTIEYNLKVDQMVDLKDTREVYNWEQELKQVFPDIEMVRQNMFRSILRAGVTSVDDLDNREMRSNLYHTAFPYRIDGGQ